MPADDVDVNFFADFNANYSNGTKGAPSFSAQHQFDWASCSLPSSSTAQEDFARRAYVIAGPIVLTLGLCGNFAIIAILSKHRFRPFPITTLVKSHAIANIFCLFIGLFLGDYFRALSNFDFQHQLGTWGCRIHLAMSYALRYVTSWHYATISGFRLLMATSPSFYTSRYSRFLVRSAIVIILLLAFVLSSHIFWSLAFQSSSNLNMTKSNATSSSRTMMSSSVSPSSSSFNNNNSTRTPPPRIIGGGEGGGKNLLRTKSSSSSSQNATKSICRLSCAESFYSSWRIVDLTSAVIIPFGIVLINAIALPLILYRQSTSSPSTCSNGTAKNSAATADANNIAPVSHSPVTTLMPRQPSYDDYSTSSSYHNSLRRPSGTTHRNNRHRHGHRSSMSPIEIMASHLAAMIYYQDILFLVASLPLLVYYLLIYFPPQPLPWLTWLIDAKTIAIMIERLHYIHPFANLLQYSINVILFPIYTLCNRSTRRGHRSGATVSYLSGINISKSAGTTKKSNQSTAKSLSSSNGGPGVSNIGNGTNAQLAHQHHQPPQEVSLIMANCDDVNGGLMPEIEGDFYETSSTTSEQQHLRPDDVDRLVAAITGDNQFDDV